MISREKQIWFDDFVGEPDNVEFTVRHALQEEWCIMHTSPSRAAMIAGTRDPDIYNEYALMPLYLWYAVDQHYDPNNSGDMLSMRLKKTRARYVMACQDPGPIPENMKPYVTEKPTSDYIRAHGSSPVYSNLDLARDGASTGVLIDYSDQPNFVSDAEFLPYLEYQYSQNPPVYRQNNQQWSTPNFDLTSSVDSLSERIGQYLTDDKINEFSQKAQKGISWLKKAAKGGMKRLNENERLQNMGREVNNRLNQSETYQSVRSSLANRFSGSGPAPASVSCPQCGKHLAEGDCFCSGCGLRLNKPQEEKKQDSDWDIPPEFDGLF